MDPRRRVVYAGRDPPSTPPSPSRIGAPGHVRRRESLAEPCRAGGSEYRSRRSPRRRGVMPGPDDPGGKGNLGQRTRPKYPGPKDREKASLQTGNSPLKDERNNAESGHDSSAST
jgi:hypothetical protein